MTTKVSPVSMKEEAKTRISSSMDCCAPRFGDERSTKCNKEDITYCAPRLRLIAQHISHRNHERFLTIKRTVGE